MVVVVEVAATVICSGGHGSNVGQSNTTAGLLVETAAVGQWPL